MSIAQQRWVGMSLILLMGLALCLPFLSSHLFFDDEYFFQPGNVQRFLADGWHLYPRWWVNGTFAVTYAGIGPQILWLRLGNLLLHLGVTISLFALIYSLLRDLDRRLSLPVSVEVAAMLATALFVLHPLAIFTQGYLIQRTTLCAVLFSLLSLLAFWRGLSGSRMALWGSCGLFALAVYAKEHAIMLPLVAFLLLVLRVRSGLPVVVSVRSALAALLLQCGISLLVFLQIKGIVGTPYEVLTGEMLEGEIEIDKDRLYPLSVLNQAGLFFKYLGLWVFPEPNSVSVDIRPGFPLDFAGWWLWVGASAFGAYVVGACVLLLRGGACGVLGFSLLVPAVLYFTEFAVVRLQEPFVLYRSYLWMPFLFIALALGLRLMRVRVLLVLVLLSLPIFAAMSFLRLQTFSHPLLVWQEAADVYEASTGQLGVFGGYRIYYNLGNELRSMGFLEPALGAFNRSLELNPAYGWAWNNRGAVFLDLHNYPAAQSDYQKAVQLMPDQIASWNGLSQALEGQGEFDRAEQARKMACVLSGQVRCEPAGIK